VFEYYGVLMRLGFDLGMSLTMKCNVELQYVLEFGILLSHLRRLISILLTET
jgi:hypothetical protein